METTGSAGSEREERSRCAQREAKRRRWMRESEDECLIFLAPYCIPDPGFHEIPPGTYKEVPPWLKLVEVYLNQNDSNEHKLVLEANII